MDPMNILGIETSCDETSAAVVTDGIHLRSNVVASQDEIHSPYGGIVPEIASRCHIERIQSITETALLKANMSLDDLDGVAVTAGPGLMGSLLVGLSYAKALSYARKMPFKGINHLEGHIHAIFLEKKIEYPFIALLVSGGHTALYDVEGVGKLTLLGATKDDAAGEAFDKVAKILGLGFPGGKVIDKIAKEGNRNAYFFPRPNLHEPHFHFSFSGLKTAVLHQRKREPEAKISDIAASFQEAVVDTLVQQSLRALEFKEYQRLVVAGGVAANSRLREVFLEISAKTNIEVFFPSLSLCTDNAAMIAAIGYHYLMAGDHDSLALNAFATSRHPIS